MKTLHQSPESDIAKATLDAHAFYDEMDKKAALLAAKANAELAESRALYKAAIDREVNLRVRAALAELAAAQ